MAYMSVQRITTDTRIISSPSSTQGGGGVHEDYRLESTRRGAEQLHRRVVLVNVAPTAPQGAPKECSHVDKKQEAGVRGAAPLLAAWGSSSSETQHLPGKLKGVWVVDWLSKNKKLEAGVRGAVPLPAAWGSLSSETQHLPGKLKGVWVCCYVFLSYCKLSFWRRGCTQCGPVACRGPWESMHPKCYTLALERASLWGVGV